jgi:predicted transposase/invertase (TIGR01784 family)
MGTRSLVLFHYGVKNLLRNEADYEVLEGFLSELFRRQIQLVSVLECESNEETKNDKYNRVDMLVRDESGEFFIIKLQFIYEIDYFRWLANIVATEHLSESDTYLKVKKVYSVNIVYFDLGMGKDYVYSGKTHFTGLHEQDELQLSPTQREIFGRMTAGDLFPEYYILKINNFDSVVKDTLDEWMYYLKHSKTKDEFKAQGLKKAQVVLSKGYLTDEEIHTYDRVVDMYRSDVSSIWSAKLLGCVEGEENLIKHIAKTGIPPKSIAEMTGLSLERVMDILQSN